MSSHGEPNVRPIRDARLTDALIALNRQFECPETEAEIWDRIIAAAIRYDEIARRKAIQRRLARSFGVVAD